MHRSTLFGGSVCVRVALLPGLRVPRDDIGRGRVGLDFDDFDRKLSSAVDLPDPPPDVSMIVESSSGGCRASMK